MAPTVLGLGIGHEGPLVPDHLRQGLKKALDGMESDMQASPYDWDMFYVEPDIDFDQVTQKLRQKQWDVVMVGGTLSFTLLLPSVTDWH